MVYDLRDAITHRHLVFGSAVLTRIKNEVLHTRGRVCALFIDFHTESTTLIANSNFKFFSLITPIYSIIITT